MLPPIVPFRDGKHILRERMKAERRHAAKSRPDAAVHAAKNFIASIDIQNTDLIALYFPIKTELDTEPLASALFEAGHDVALPVVAGKKKPLIFRRYAPGDELIEGVYGARHPVDGADMVTPTIIVAPLLAFTRGGKRLGYGGGYYDRTLATLRKSASPIVVGYAFGAQEVDDLPVTPLDQPLDWVVTERGTIRC